ncbi:endoglucanase 4-like isoform X2 [Physella acuta]|nr:endoglucanase 4-like isoform X2 [Physella acuta]XP_059173956.1 endoglucanase 4-like isoform X2 [Physella acuta]
MMASWFMLCLVLPMFVTQTESVKDYESALGKSILFYDAQRSGKLPANNPIPWRGDSALNDCVVGGWYDAGDHVKFGLPMAYTTTILLWSMYKWKDSYVKAGQLNQAYDMVKWPLDYFLKAWNPTAHEFVFQVGDETADHNFWGRPEDMTMARPCKKVDVAHPGSDVTAGTAAALAVGSLVFKDKGDTAYSTQLLTAAESLYKFANDYKGLYQTNTYGSTSYKDELCEAGVWLYRATGRAQYLNEAKANAESGYIWAYQLEDKRLACHQLLYEETQDTVQRNGVIDYFNSWLPGGSIQYTPCGLAWAMKWGSLRLAANSAFIALLAAEAGIETDRYRTWAVEQINYILGDNPHDGGCYSYQIGYGSKYPLRPHHRAASCPDKPAPCGYTEANSPAPNPQVLTGALVGGPEEQDNYVDVRTDYVLNEVAIDYNSGFTGALAGIIYLQSTNHMPTTHNKCPCNN